MVTSTVPDPQTLRRGDDGRWLCNLAKGCNEPATLQAALPCPTGCDAAIVQHERLIDGKRAEIAQHEHALELVRDEMQQAAAENRLADVSAHVAAQVGHEALKQLRADLEKLEAARARVAEEHTHPVMACGKHEKRLEQPVASH